MNTVSGCCLKPIETGQKKSFPYDAETPVFYKVDYCTGCGKEVEEVVSVHGCCGLEICECEVSEIA